jgi:hypothetical protein
VFPPCSAYSRWDDNESVTSNELLVPRLGKGCRRNGMHRGDLRDEYMVLLEARRGQLRVKVLSTTRTKSNQLTANERPLAKRVAGLMTTMSLILQIGQSGTVNILRNRRIMID